MMAINLNEIIPVLLQGVQDNSIIPRFIQDVNPKWKLEKFGKDNVILVAIVHEAYDYTDEEGKIQTVSAVVHFSLSTNEQAEYLGSVSDGLEDLISILQVKREHGLQEMLNSILGS
jgi:hypothetical protein